MENLNIVHLIEKNSITRLTRDYENKFLIKIKENFNDNQHCKACRKIKRGKESSEKKEQEKKDNKKQCVKCEEFLKFNMFLKYIDKDDTIMGYYYDECMNCHDSLQCNKCNTIKEKTQFSKDLSKRTGYKTICKLCTNNG